MSIENVTPFQNEEEMDATDVTMEDNSNVEESEEMEETEDSEDEETSLEEEEGNEAE